MKTVLVIIQSVMYNRGSEALCRGISKIIKTADENAYVILNSAESSFPGKLNLPHVDEYVKRLSFTSRKSPKAIIAYICDKFLKNKRLANKVRYKKLLHAAKKSDIIIVMAGDNFDNSPSYDFSGNSMLYMMLKEQNNAKLIMYDCSMGKENITKSIIEGFNKCDEVTARDSISLENLKNAGIEKVKYYPDPAFVMDKEECPLPDGWQEGKMLGVNLSNLILREKYGGSKETILKSYYNMIDAVLEKTEMSIVLIPHVMNNADLSILKIIFEKYKDNKRVILIDNEKLSAPNLKYIISKCEAYVGARTHSTIAAYSCCVPTLVVGYSVKSKGIATDLFGTDNHYVVPVFSIENENNIQDEVFNLIENRESIRKNLVEKMPEYIEKAYGVQELI